MLFRTVGRVGRGCVGGGAARRVHSPLSVERAGACPPTMQSEDSPLKTVLHTYHCVESASVSEGVGCPRSAVSVRSSASATAAGVSSFVCSLCVWSFHAVWRLFSVLSLVSPCVSLRVLARWRMRKCTLKATTAPKSQVYKHSDRSITTAALVQLVRPATSPVIISNAAIILSYKWSWLVHL